MAYGGLQKPCRDDRAVEEHAVVALQVVQKLGGGEPHHVVWGGGIFMIMKYIQILGNILNKSLKFNKEK